MIISTSLKKNKNKPVKNLIKKKIPKKSIKTDVKEFSEVIIKKETSINRELFKKYFNSRMTTEMLKVLYNLNDRKKNNKLVNIIKSGLSDLKDEIERMPEDEIKIEKPHKIVDIFEKILGFNRQNQQGQGLKILTSNQMLSDDDQ